MLKLYGMTLSGNCHKVRLLLEQLDRPYQWQEVDILKGESKTAEFLSVNPAGQVPTLQIEPGKYLTESNAMLYYLAEGSPFWSDDPYLKAQTLSWMFFEQYSHEPYIAVARFIKKFFPAGNDRLVELPRLHEKGSKALQIMEQHLSVNDFFVDNIYSIADISLYAYTHCAGEGGFDVSTYPAISSWLTRIEEQDRFVGMSA